MSLPVRRPLREGFVDEFYARGYVNDFHARDTPTLGGHVGQETGQDRGTPADIPGG